MRGCTKLMLIGLALAAVVIPGCGPASNPGDESRDGPPPIELPPTQSYDCREVPESGRCAGESAIYCDRRSASIVEKRCGARGLVCDDSQGQARCVDENGDEQDVPTEEENETATSDPSDCGDITNVGTCDEATNTLSYCGLVTNALTTVDCAAKSDTIEYQCGYDEDKEYFDCLPADYGECGQELFAGERCNADSSAVEFCVTETLTIGTEECGDDSMCELDDYGVSDCTLKSCDDLGWAGKCNADGSAFTYCDVDTTRQMVTTACTDGTTCGYDSIDYAECK